MSYDYSAKKNKNPKVYFRQYLYNSNEPMDDVSSDTPREHETELLENSFVLRRDFRHVAKGIRNRYV